MDNNNSKETLLKGGSKVLLMPNTLPNIPVDEPAIWRKILIIPYIEKEKSYQNFIYKCPNIKSDTISNLFENATRLEIDIGDLGEYKRLSVEEVRYILEKKWDISYYKNLISYDGNVNGIILPCSLLKLRGFYLKIDSFTNLQELETEHYLQDYDSIRLKVLKIRNCDNYKILPKTLEKIQIKYIKPIDGRIDLRKFSLLNKLKITNLIKSDKCRLYCPKSLIKLNFEKNDCLLILSRSVRFVRTRSSIKIPTNTELQRLILFSTDNRRTIHNAENCKTLSQLYCSNKDYSFFKNTKIEFINISDNVKFQDFGLKLNKNIEIINLTMLNNEIYKITIHVRNRVKPQYISDSDDDHNEGKDTNFAENDISINIPKTFPELIEMNIISSIPCRVKLSKKLKRLSTQGPIKIISVRSELQIARIFGYFSRPKYCHELIIQIGTDTNLRGYQIRKLNISVENSPKLELPETIETLTIFGNAIINWQNLSKLRKLKLYDYNLEIQLPNSLKILDMINTFFYYHELNLPKNIEIVRFNRRYPFAQEIQRQLGNRVTIY